MTARKAVKTRIVRTSVSLPAELSQTIDAIAQKKRVSRAWIVRDALEAYLRDQWPLLEKKV